MLGLSGLAVSGHFQRWQICRNIRRVRRLLTISPFNLSQRQRQFGHTFPDNAGLPPDLGNGEATCSYLMAKCGNGGLGPKVYFALAAKQNDHGSTRLHCDLTDAVNVCVYAAQQSDGSPGGARWDIFSPQDTTRLRKILSVHTKPEDPVLAQNTYLTPARLRELELSHGIKAYTFFQHEGEAVFIPAGCAHQVSYSLICVTTVQDVESVG